MQPELSKKQTVLVLFAVVAFMLGIWWSISSAKLAVQAKSILLNQVNQAMNGRLEAEKVAVSLNKIVLSKAIIYDEQNAEVIGCDRIVVAYSFRDMLNGKFGLESVKDIMLENVKFSLTQVETKQWNISRLLKPAADTKSRYGGQIHVVNGTVAVITEMGQTNLDAIKATVTIGEHPKVELLMADLMYGGQKIKLTGYIEEFTQAAKLFIDFSALGLDTKQVAADLYLNTSVDIQGRIEGGIDKPVVTGSFTAPKGMWDATEFTAAKGDFQYRENVMYLQSVDLNAYDGKVQISGSIQSASPQLLTVYVNVYGVDSARIAPDSGIRGIGNYYTVVSGTVKNPAVSGNFEIAQGAARDIAISEAKGRFRLAAPNLIIEAATARALGGFLEVSGSIGNGGFSLNVRGQSVDIAQLVQVAKPSSVKSPPPPVTGSMSVAAVFTGVTSVSQAEGTFQAPAGTIADNEFTNAHGNFRYDGQKLYISNAQLDMDGGTVRGNGSIGVVRDEYVFSLSGEGLDGRLLTDNQVRANIAFNADGTGEGDLRDINMNGRFSMGSGTVGGIPFTSAQGNFAKNNRKYTFNDVHFAILGGLVSGEVSVNGKTFSVKVQSPQGAIETNEKQLRDKLLEELLGKEKASGQPDASGTSPPANTAPDQGKSKPTLPEFNTETILDILKQLPDKKR